jgi:hypothetical protein
MTVLKIPIRRELPISFDRRQWSVEVRPLGLEFRAKRERQTYFITWESVLHRTMEIAADAARREKALSRRKA